MSEAILYTVLVTIVTFLLAAIWYLRQKDAKADGGVGEVRPRVPRPRVGGEDGAVAAPNRVIAQRNARGRMRAAAAAQHHDEDSDDGEGNVADDIALPDGKVGKKKLAKLQAKADRRIMREAEEREREDRKERKEKAEEDRKKDEQKEAEEVARKEEEERKEREEKARREQEEYEKMKAMFEVEEEGEGFEETDEDKEKNLLSEFVSYVKTEKVVVLEDLASKFKLKTQDAIARLATLQKDGTLTGVIDDRGKFIYISRQELEGVAKFIRQRGRVSLTELAESSTSLITLTPDTPVQS